MKHQFITFLAVAVLVWAISNTPINPSFKSILIHIVISLGASITIIRYTLDYLSKKPPAPGLGLGFELLQLLKQDSRLKDIPFVIMTSRGANRRRNEFIDNLGIQGYFTKPYIESKILEHTERLVSKDKF